MNNLSIYEKVRSCPGEALKPIQAGKLKGKSDINPMWRIKKLTELFGPCGVGWKTMDESFWTTPGAGGEVIAWCSIKLLWRDGADNEWSDPVFGVGGAMMVDTQKGNLTTNDDAFKMAYTDAISVACKALGFAADVYWQQDRTKYDAPPAPPTPIAPPAPTSHTPRANGHASMCSVCLGDLSRAEHEYSMKYWGKPLCRKCQKTEPKNENPG